MKKAFTIPVVHAESLIPAGPYCYTPVQGPCAENGSVFRVKCCPFWRTLPGLPEQRSGWCDYLRTGDNEADGTLLLWDQVKECGIKDSDEDFNRFELAAIDANF